MKWLILFIAIIGETIGTSALKESEGFTKLPASLIAIVGYGIAFYFLSLTLKEMPMGIAYAIWSAVGIVILAIIGYLKFNQTLDIPAIIGIILIILGVITMNVFSKSISH